MEKSGVSVLGVDLNVLVVCHRLENRESEKASYAWSPNARKTTTPVALSTKISPVQRGYFLAGWLNSNPPCSGYFSFCSPSFFPSLPKVISVPLAFLVLFDVASCMCRQFFHVTFSVSSLAIVWWRKCQRSTLRNSSFNCCYRVMWTKFYAHCLWGNVGSCLYFRSMILHISISWDLKGKHPLNSKNSGRFSPCVSLYELWADSYTRILCNPQC